MSRNELLYMLQDIRYAETKEEGMNRGAVVKNLAKMFHTAVGLLQDSRVPYAPYTVPRSQVQPTQDARALGEFYLLTTSGR